jgi:hypothetical protein
VNPVSILVTAVIATAPAGFAAGASFVYPVAAAETGLVCPPEIVGTREAPETASGSINIIDQDTPIAVDTRDVPLEPEVSFGLRTRLTEGFPDLYAMVEVEHPPFPGTGIVLERFDTVLTADRWSLNTFRFEHGYELQPGKWTFRIVAEGRVLVEEVFDVRRGLGNPLNRVCGSPDYLS